MNYNLLFINTLFRFHLINIARLGRISLFPFRSKIFTISPRSRGDMWSLIIISYIIKLAKQNHLSINRLFHETKCEKKFGYQG